MKERYFLRNAFIEADLIGADDVILNELKTTMEKCLNVNQVILFRKGTDSIKTYLKDTAT